MKISYTDQGQLGRLLSSQRELGRTIGIAALLAFSISTVSGLIVGNEVIPRWVLWAACAIFTVLGLWAFIKSMLIQLQFSEIFEAAVFIDPKNNNTISVNDYAFSESLSRTLNAIKAENAAIYAEWEREPLSQRHQQQPEPIAEALDRPNYMAITRVKIDKPQIQPSSGALLEEASLYVILEFLSTHLSTYFNSGENDAHIKEFSRNDFPEFLLKNRFLNLLSTPIEERPIFLKAFPDPDKRPEGDIFSLWGSDGAVFSRFDLSLPIGSKLTHYGRNGLSVSTKRVQLTVSVAVKDTSVSFSPIFAQRYIGYPYREIDSRNVIITFSGKIHPWYVFSAKGWELYRWMDSFKEQLSTKVDFKTFLNHINWHSFIEPLIFSNRKLEQRRNEISTSESDTTK